MFVALLRDMIRKKGVTATTSQHNEDFFTRSEKDNRQCH